MRTCRFARGPEKQAGTLSARRVLAYRVGQRSGVLHRRARRGTGPIVPEVHPDRVENIREVQLDVGARSLAETSHAEPQGEARVGARLHALPLDHLTTGDVVENGE